MSSATGMVQGWADWAWSKSGMEGWVPSPQLGHMVERSWSWLKGNYDSTLLTVAKWRFDPKNTIPTHARRLDALTGDRGLSQMIHAISHMGSQRLSHDLTHLKPWSEEAPGWPQEAFGLAIGRETAFGREVGRQLKDNAPEYVRELIENALLKGAGNLVDKLHGRVVHKADDRRFQLGLFHKILGAATAHLHRTREVLKSEGEQLNGEEFVEAFGYGFLHDGVPHRADMNEAERRKHRLEQFFKPFARDLMAMAFPNGAQDFEMPFQSPFGQKLYDAVQDTIVPNLLLEMVGSLLEPQNLDKMLLSTFENLNDTRGRKGRQSLPSLPKGRQYQELAGVCGNLGEEMIRFLAPTAGGLVLKYPGAKEKLGEQLALGIARSVQQYSVKDLLNKAIRSGLPSLHPGQFETDSEGQLGFTPQSETGKYHFTWPTTDEERKAKEQAAYREAEEIRTRLKEEISYFAVKLAKAGIDVPRNYLHSFWTKVDQTVEDALKPLLSKKAGQQVRAVVVQPLHFIFCTLLVNLLHALVVLPIWTFLEGLLHMYLRYKVDTVIEAVHRPVLEDLIYRSLDIAKNELAGSSIRKASE